MGIYSGIKSIAVGTFFGGVMILGGGQEVLVSMNNREPLEVTCADLQKMEPRREWVKMKDCSFDVSNASYFYEEKSKKITDLYIPVYPASGTDDGKTKVSLHTTDPGWMNLMMQIRDLREAKKDVDQFLEAHTAELQLKGTFTGLVESGMSKDDSEHAKLRETDPDLSEGFFVVRHNKSPSMATGAAFIGVGLLSGISGLFFGIRRWRR